MANIHVSDLQPVDRICSEAEFLEAVSDSVARAVQARGFTFPIPIIFGFLWIE